MEHIELQIDVTEAAALGSSQHLAATIYLPDTKTIPTPPIIVFAVPGGSYSRHYFDLHFDGHEGYSQAEHHAAQGIIMVALDHIGVGDSSIPDLGRITFDTLADTYDAAVREVKSRFATGAISPHLLPLGNACHIGIGQSMGGCVTILAQGRHQTFDAIAPLGFSAIHTTLPQKSAKDTEATQAVFANVQVGTADTPTSKFVANDFAYAFH